MVTHWALISVESATMGLSCRVGLSDSELGSCWSSLHCSQQARQSWAYSSHSWNGMWWWNMCSDVASGRSIERGWTNPITSRFTFQCTDVMSCPISVGEVSYWIRIQFDSQLRSLELACKSDLFTAIVLSARHHYLSKMGCPESLQSFLSYQHQVRRCSL